MNDRDKTPCLCAHTGLIQCGKCWDLIEQKAHEETIGKCIARIVAIRSKLDKIQKTSKKRFYFHKGKKAGLNSALKAIKKELKEGEPRAKPQTERGGEK